MRASKAVRKYLAAHAEPEAQLARSLSRRSFANALVVPAYGETEDFFRLHDSIPESPLGPVLTIVVVNGRADSPSAVHDANAWLCAELDQRLGAASPVGSNARLFDRASPLLLIERSRQDHFLPARQGVGLARKIGADIALAMAAEDRIASRWLHCTDADAQLPADYFANSASCKDTEASALVYPFEHVHFESEGPLAASKIALEYEISLRYSVLGLHDAGSPYALQTIGSTMAIDFSRYAEARGFPRRMAAEDFHLLSKLRKLGSVVDLAGDPILLSDRASERVPFGTGAAIRKVADSADPSAPRAFYDPRIFAILKTWLARLRAAAKDPGIDLAEVLASEDEGPRLLAELNATGQLERARRALKEGKDESARLRRLHDGFDALATLKLIHGLRDSGLPSIPLRDAIAAAPFTTLRGNEALEDMRATLAREEADRSARDR